MEFSYKKSFPSATGFIMFYGGVSYHNDLDSLAMSDDGSETRSSPQW